LRIAARRSSSSIAADFLAASGIAPAGVLRDRWVLGRVPAVRREWEPEELIASWTLTDRDWELIANKSGATRLGFALLVRFFDLEARFPAHPGELPQAAVEYVAGLVKVAPGALADYEWSGRTIEVSPGADPSCVRVP
jgi:hypothetical protein